jgi:hypothetical protein
LPLAGLGMSLPAEVAEASEAMLSTALANKNEIEN